jgi:hypothetical protein
MNALNGTHHLARMLKNTLKRTVGSLRNNLKRRRNNV